MTHHGPSDVPGVVKHLAGRAGRAMALLASYGQPGSGKSEGNILMGAQAQKIMGGPPLSVSNLKHQLVFKPKKFPAMSKAAGQRRVVFCDEGSGEGANRMQPMAKDNVGLDIDLDAARGRGQVIFWAAPNRKKVATSVQLHTTWAVEWNLDHSATFWEADPVDPMFGKEPYFHERFTETRFPWLGDYLPELQVHYQRDLKGAHNVGRDVEGEARQERQLQAYLARIAKVLG